MCGAGQRTQPVARSEARNQNRVQSLHWDRSVKWVLSGQLTHMKTRLLRDGRAEGFSSVTGEAPRLKRVVFELSWCFISHIES
jgi:hypothetical protein